MVSVLCVSWCAVPLFSCPSGAPLSGVSMRCCARCVLAVPPSVRAPLARLLATPSFFRGFVALYPFLYPSPWHALFPCAQPAPPLWCVSRSFSLPARRSLSLGLLCRTCEEETCTRACGGGGFVAPWHLVIAILRWCGMSPISASFVCSSLLFLTVLCLLRRLLPCVVWRRFIFYLLWTWLHTPLWPPPLFVVRPACAA